MPLIHSKSPKAFKKNVETEMNTNPSPKDRAQNLSIAYSVQRKAKKMATGGPVHSEKDTEHAMHSSTPTIGELKPMPHPVDEDIRIHEAAITELKKVRDRDLHMMAGGEVIARDDEDTKHAMDSHSPKGGALESHASSVMSETGSNAEDIVRRRKKSMEFDTGEAGYTEDGSQGRGISIGDFAKGGFIEDEEKPHSIADAIMRKKQFYADGGMVDLDSNEEEQPNGYYERNEHTALDEDRDATMDGMKQPWDSNEKDPGDELLEESDENDHIDKIMKKRKKS